MSRFQGKRILITGATRGIGFAGACRIAAEGGTVIATGRNPQQLENLQKRLPEHATVLQNDVSNADDIQKLADIVADSGGLDGLWLNAGHARTEALEQVTSQGIDDVLASNLKGPMLQMTALSEHLHTGASVVVTASTSVYEGAPTTSVYAAAKGALVAAARCWAAELGSRNIRVNTLVPGPIDTSFREFMPLEARKAFENTVTAQLAIPRIGTPEEAAAVGMFLLSDDASFVTGSQYMVDGGLLMQ